MMAVVAAMGQGQGVPRRDRNSAVAHEQLLNKARQGGIDLYFAGDSITRRWGTSDAQYAAFYANWKENFFGWNAGNFGWGADSIEHILWRLENGELDGVNPKAIVLLGGTNNIGGALAADRADAKVEEVSRGVEAVLGVMKEKAPGAVVIVMGILPRNDRGTAVAGVIDRINERIARMADGKRVRYLNINGKLADAEGRLLEGVTVDRLHLSVKGYQIWADALRPVLEEVLGARAATDHAPAATGDPGVK